MSYPFRFYGATPSDWFEGANDGHLFEVSFCSAPSDVDRATLAADFERFFAAGPARPAPSPWLWSGHVAKFAIGERWSSSARACFARVTDFLRQEHRRMPISDVVFWGSRSEEPTRWDRWSMARQERPDPGPSYPDGSGLRPNDPELSAAAEDPAFEKARADSRRSLAERRLERATAGSGVRLVPIDDTERDGSIPDWARAQVGEPVPKYIDDKYTRADGLHAVTSAPRVTAIRFVDNRPAGQAFVADDGTVREVAYPDGVNPSSYRIDVHPDGTRALSHDIRTLYELNFETGAATRRFVADTGVTSMGFVDQGDRWILRTHTGIFVLDPSTPTPTQLCVAKRKGIIYSTFHLVRDATVVATNDGDKNCLYGYCGGKLKKLVNLPVRFTQVFDDEDGNVTVRAWADGVWQRYRVDGLDEVYEAWAAPMRARAEKKRAKAAAAAKTAKTAPAAKQKKATKLTVESAEGVFTPAPSQRADDETRAAFPEEAALATASGAVIGTLLDKEKHACILYRPAGGALNRIETDALAALGAKPWSLRRRTVTPCGTLGIVSHNNDPYGTLVIDLKTGDVQLCKRETPYGDQTAAQRLGPETVVVQLEPAGYAKHKKGRRLEVLVRKQKRWGRTASVIVTESVATVSHGPFLAVRAKAATTLVVFGADDTGALLKLGQFKERVHDVAFDAEGRLLFVNPEGDLHQVVGLADVLERKAAAAAKKKKKKR